MFGLVGTLVYNYNIYVGLFSEFEDYRPGSRASSSASSISYQASQNSSMNRLHQGWSSPFPYQHRFSSSLDHPRSPMVAGQVHITGSYSDVTSDGELSQFFRMPISLAFQGVEFGHTFIEDHNLLLFHFDYFFR